MTLDTIIKEDGTLIAKLPKTFGGKQVRSSIESSSLLRHSGWSFVIHTLMKEGLNLVFFKSLTD